MTRIPLIAPLVAAALAAAPAAASAAVTCSFDSAKHRLTVGASADSDVAGLTRSGNAIVVKNGAGLVTCSGPAPTVFNTDSIAYTDTAPATGQLHVDLSGGQFAPGFSDEGELATAEIEISVEAGSGYDTLAVYGSSGADDIHAGVYDGYEERVDLDPDDIVPDTDIVAHGVESQWYFGGGGDDTLDADGDGAIQGVTDQLALYGDGDDDTLVAGDGPAYLNGGDGADTLTGAGSADVIVPGDGDDTIDGGYGKDKLAFDPQHLTGVHVDLDEPDPQNTGQGTDGIAGIEDVAGTNGPDVLHGDTGPNALDGRGGNDVIDGDRGDDVIRGGDGTDTVDYTHSPGPMTMDLGGPAPQQTSFAAGDDTVTEVENVVGTSFDDAITGTGGPNVLNGRSGKDTLKGAGGADTLIGGRNPEAEPDGADVLDGGTGTDTVSYAERTTRVVVSLDGVANDGADPNVDGTSAAAEEGDNAKAIEIAGAGNDRLAGAAGANTLKGGKGADTLVGGLGADTLDGGLGTDTISYAARSAAVAVTLDGIANDGADPNHDGISAPGEERDKDVAVENATGGSGDDRLTALAAPLANVLRGGPGADLLDAKDATSAVDKLDCGGGSDKHRSDPSDTKSGCEQVAP
ncbi:MAG TPA: calcium-binding protein [Solirubrobacteraceae bacterium]|jgi:Ca2+-binding RTX toxin-like protein